MKSGSILLSVLAGITLSACRLGSRPSSHDLIDAENGFAELSKETNTRQAFLTYLTDSTVLFHAGAITMGGGTWQTRPADSALLFWWPTFVSISHAGDLGFTSGPWEWSPNRHSPNPASSGYYASVWQYRSDTRWKLAVDIGTSLQSPEAQPASLQIIAPASDGSMVTSGADFLAIDTAYIFQLNKDSVSFERSVLSDKARLLRPDRPPFDMPTIPSETGYRYHFEQKGGRLASSDDLGYVYGTVAIAQSAQAVSAHEGNYLRVWRREQEGWRVILDVIN